MACAAFETVSGGAWESMCRFLFGRADWGPALTRSASRPVVAGYSFGHMILGVERKILRFIIGYMGCS